LATQNLKAERSPHNIILDDGVFQQYQPKPVIRRIVFLDRFCAACRKKVQMLGKLVVAGRNYMLQSMLVKI
jgi:hypothetical protein